MFSRFFKSRAAKASPPSDDRERLKQAVLALLAQADAAFEAGRVDEAVQLYHDTLANDPDNVYANYCLGGIYWNQKRLAEARNCCERGLAVEPDQVGLLALHGAIVADMNDHALAIQDLLRVAELAPDYPDLDQRLGDQFHIVGMGKESVEAYERAIARTPDNTLLQSDRLFVLNQFKLLDRKQLFEEHSRWGAKIEALHAPARLPHDNDPDPARQLRVGYVSADLRDHAVAYFLEGVLQNHDHTTCEIVVFDVSPLAEDHVTVRLKRLVRTWRRVADLSDDALASTIRNARIDVLVDLSGHTGWNRLPVFARKPAPVQVSWLGYMNTTGLRSMDYRITDGYMDPAGESESFYTETLFRIPSMACFSPSADSPAVNAMPALESGVFTFGSMNQWSKVSIETRTLWAQILVASDNFRLIVIARGAQFENQRLQVIEEFVSRGVKAEQIQVLPMLGMHDYMRLFNHIDLALDPFPYGGGTTSLHTIWMGVPIVTLEGESELARACSGILRTVGCDHLVTHSIERYRDLAIELGRHPEQLSALRGELRERMRRSPLVDAADLTRNLEGAYRTMWQAYCATQRA